MSEDIYLRVVVDDSQLTDAELRHKHRLADIGLKVEIAKYNAEQAEQLGIKAEEQAEVAKTVAVEAEEISKRSFHMVMTGMRTSYLLFAGLGRIMGGGMTMMFRTMYTMGMATVGLYKALVPAVGAVNPLQAMIMMASLITATIQLGGVLSGQKELTRNARGYNMMLHGISGMIGSYSL